MAVICAIEHSINTEIRVFFLSSDQIYYFGINVHKCAHFLYTKDQKANYLLFNILFIFQIII